MWHPLSCTWRKSAGRIPFSLGKKPQCLKRQGFVEDWLPSSQSSVENKNGGTLVQKEFQESRGPSKHSPGSPLSPSAINPLDDPKAQSYRAVVIYQPGKTQLSALATGPTEPAVPAFMSARH